jgi:fumarylacetoacetase
MTTLNETHDPTLQSWVESANAPNSDFPIQNLPFGVFRLRDTIDAFHIGVAIGDSVLDLSAVARTSTALAETVQDALGDPDAATLNALMAKGPLTWSELRLALSRALRSDAIDAAVFESCLVAQADIEHAVPARIGDYTDFYASVYHATNIGKLFRPDAPLLPNYKWIPIGYHGRSSTIGVSGERFHRPVGQTMPPGAEKPSVGPTRRLDYEFEVGIFIGMGNEDGTPIPIELADQYVFGLCLLNDWSARDIQAWEYQPLGPFLAKNFATTISPWIVTTEALAPFRTTWHRADGDPQPLAYLDAPSVRKEGAFDIQLEALLSTAKSDAANRPAMHLTRTTFRHAYWTVGQMVAHHTVNGCRLMPGDLFGSGTASGPNATEAGALIELVEGGKKPLTLPNGETRTFLEDCDTVVFRAWCEKAGARRIGFGECRGTVLPAR